MTELAVYFPREIAVRAEQVISEAGVPLLPAEKIASGVFHPDRIPTLPLTKVPALAGELASDHIAELNPHSQYALTADLADLYTEITTIQDILDANNLTAP